MSEEKQQVVTSSRLGKEAKIGVAVIAALLAVFVAVVAIRLFGGGGSDDGPSVAATSVPADEPNGPADSPAATISEPTVLLAEAESQRPLGDDSAGWKLAAPLPSPPAELQAPPDVPATPPDDVDYGSPAADPFAPDQIVERPPAYSYAPPASSVSSSDPSVAPVPDAPADFAGSSGYQPPDATADSPDNGMSAPSYHGFSSVGSNAVPPPLPPYREPSGSDDSASLPPPPGAPTHDNRGHGESSAYAPPSPESPWCRASTVGTRRNLRRGRTYKVNSDDTLFDIARYELGKASRWVEIYELNRDVLGDDCDLITPGTVLVLPDDGRPDVLAEPQNSGFRR